MGWVVVPNKAMKVPKVKKSIKILVGNLLVGVIQTKS